MPAGASTGGKTFSFIIVSNAMTLISFGGLASASRLTVSASGNVERIQLLYPVARGPKRKKARRGGLRVRGNIDTKVAVKMVSMSTGFQGSRLTGSGDAQAGPSFSSTPAVVFSEDDVLPRAIVIGNASAETAARYVRRRARADRSRGRARRDHRGAHESTDHTSRLRIRALGQTGDWR